MVLNLVFKALFLWGYFIILKKKTAKMNYAFGGLIRLGHQSKTRVYQSIGLRQPTRQNGYPKEL